MKICPLCGATCFDDMEVCYCCMHRFEEDEGESPECWVDDGDARLRSCDERGLLIRECDNGRRGRGVARDSGVDEGAGEDVDKDNEENAGEDAGKEGVVNAGKDAGKSAGDGVGELAGDPAGDAADEDADDGGEKVGRDVGEDIGEDAGEIADAACDGACVETCASEASGSHEDGEGRCADVRDVEEPPPTEKDDFYTVTAGAASGERRHPPVFAFGPTIDTLEGVGGCVRIDIPLRAITEMLIAARTAQQESDWADLPPAA